MSKPTSFGSYKIESSIRNGTSKNLLLVTDPSGVKFAAKCQRSDDKPKTFNFDVKILKHLQSKSHYVPIYLTSGSDDAYMYCVTELCGPSLKSAQKALKTCMFSMSTSLRVAYHTLCALEQIHENGIVHRDVKPENIAVTGDHDYPIKLLNFGLSKIYLDKAGKHVPERKDVGFRGTAKYASLNALHGRDLSRRDDLISWFYVLTELIFGSLPWSSLKDKTRIMEKKSENRLNGMFLQFKHLLRVLEMIQELRYDEKPNYEQMKKCIIMTMDELNVEWSQSYDWESTEIQLEYGSSDEVLREDENFDLSMSEKQFADADSSQNKTTNIFDKFAMLFRRDRNGYSRLSSDKLVNLI